MAAEVLRREKEGAKSTMIVVAEGAYSKDGKQSRHSTRAASTGSAASANSVGAAVAERTDKESAHLHPGPSPARRSTDVTRSHPRHAIRSQGGAINPGGKIWHHGQLSELSGARRADLHAVHRLKRVDPEGQMVQTARAVEISFGN